MKKILSAIFFSLGCIAVVPLYADNISGMPDWSEPTPIGAFDAAGAGKVSFSFSSSGGTKTGPGGTATYSFNIPKGNVVSISVSADDSATVSVPAANVGASSHWDASQKKIVSGQATSAFVDTDEISGDTIPVTITYSNAGGPYSLSFTVSVERVKADISTVNISAPSKLILSQDDGVPFDGSDWVKNRSRNGTLRESNPISVTSGNALTFVPTFDITEETLPAKVRAEFSGFGSTTVSQIKDYASISSGIELPAPVATGSIDYFDNSLTVTWSVQYSGCDKWFPAGTSSHEVYFTRTAPQTELRQETLFWVACSGTVCGKTTDTEITDAIWSKFSTGAGPANLTRKDGVPMTYWGALASSGVGGRGYFTCEELLAFSDGKCGAWARLFSNALSLQGVENKDFGVRPVNHEDEDVMIANYTFEGEATERYSYALYPSEDEYLNMAIPSAIDEIGIPGQNNPNPKSVFSDHALVSASGRVFDPSYGLVWSNVLQWESGSVAGFASWKPVDYIEIPDEESRQGCRLKSPDGGEIEVYD